VRGYQHAIDEFVAWYCSEPRLAFNKAVVLRYRFHLEERGLILWNSLSGEFIGIPKKVIGMAATCKDNSRAVANVIRRGVS
jgi:hypothetical protein